MLGFSILFVYMAISGPLCLNSNSKKLGIEYQFFTNIITFFCFPKSKTFSLSSIIGAMTVAF